MDAYSYIANADAAAIETLYQAYQQNPESVDFGWRKFFEGFDFSQQFPEGASVLPGTAAAANGSTNGTPTSAAKAPAAPQPDNYGVLNTAASTNNASGLSSGEMISSNKETAVSNLIHAYRSRGHLRARTNPVRERKDRQPRLDLPDFGLSEADMDTVFKNGEGLGLGPHATLRDIVVALEKIYTGPIGFEYMYIRDPQVLDWFRAKVERDSLAFNPGVEYKKRILKKLNEAVVFENFLHTKFLGQKRFSLEGGGTHANRLDKTQRQQLRCGLDPEHPRATQHKQAQAGEQDGLAPQAVGQWPPQQLPHRKAGEENTQAGTHRACANLQLFAHGAERRQVHVHGEVTEHAQPRQIPSETKRIFH